MPEQTIVPPIPNAKDFNGLRAWRMAHNQDDYPRDNSYHEGFAGVVGCVTDRWCRECESRIDVPHRKNCSVTAKEEAMVTNPSPSAPPPGVSPEMLELVNDVLREHSLYTADYLTYDEWSAEKTKLLTAIATLEAQLNARAEAVAPLRLCAPDFPPNCVETAESPLYRALTACDRCGLTKLPAPCPVCDTPAMRETLDFVRGYGDVASGDVAAAFDISAAAACNRLAALRRHSVIRRIRQEVAEGGGRQYIYAAVTPPGTDGREG